MPPRYLSRVGVCVDQRPVAITQGSCVAGVVPDRAPAVVIEAAPFGVILIRVHPADLAGLHYKIRESVHMIGCISQRPRLKLD